MILAKRTKTRQIRKFFPMFAIFERIFTNSLNKYSFSLASFTIIC
nr:MAG TPA: hypothetical protein [Herelleviridae sp.]